MIDLFDLILLGIGAVFVVKVIQQYIKIKKETREGTDDQG